MKSYVADFETTVTEPHTRVWAYGVVEIGNLDNFIHGKDIDSFMDWTRSQDNPTVYFHNLKFDGEFLIHWLLTHGYRYSEIRDTMTFNCLISRQGAFYQIQVIHKKKNKKYEKVTFLDSYKKIPFSVAVIADAFKLPMAKGEIDYKKYRPVGYNMAENELDYLQKDVRIVAAALDIQFNQGLEKMTIGADALADFKNLLGGPKKFLRKFPLLPLDIDADIRQAYRGGWTYLSTRHANKEIPGGIVLDVNSLYPSVMYDMDLPYSIPMFFKGEYVPDEYYPLYIQQLTCVFDLKPGFLPMIQLKNNPAYQETEYLTTSGPEEVTMILSSVDMELFFRHYDVQVLEYVNGWKFKSCNGVFKDYIDKWMAVKMNNTGAIRTLAKLMLNSLYGKFATNPDITGRFPILAPDGHVQYLDKDEEFRDPVYTPMGIFITSWARYKTISAAQSLYDRFIYADTDSLHLVGTSLPDTLEIHDKDLGKWGHESTFTRAKFIKAKTYVEEINGELHVICAGMPDNVKTDVTFDNFKRGFKSEENNGKLMPRHVPGGIILMDSTFTIK